MGEIKSYSVSLQKDLVDRAKKQYKKYGSKLSPLLNKLLEDWCEQEEKENGC